MKTHRSFSHVLVIYRIEDWRKFGKRLKSSFVSKINEGDKEVISMMVMGGYSDTIRRSKRPHNYRTSIALVNKRGNTIYTKKGKPKKRSLCLNEGVWKKYQRHNRDPQTKRTDCSALRAFLQKYPNSTNEDLCLLVERIVEGSVKEWHQLTLNEQQRILKQRNNVIIIKPVQRKKPSRIIR